MNTPEIWESYTVWSAHKFAMRCFQTESVNCNSVAMYSSGFSYDDLVLYATLVDGFTAVWTDYVGESKHGAADAVLWFSANFWFAALLPLRKKGRI